MTPYVRRPQRAGSGPPPPPAWLYGAARGGLEPAAHGDRVPQVLRTESSLEVLLFSRYDDIVGDRDRPHECRQEPHAVGPEPPAR